VANPRWLGRALEARRAFTPPLTHESWRGNTSITSERINNLSDRSTLLRRTPNPFLLKSPRALARTRDLPLMQFLWLATIPISCTLLVSMEKFFLAGLWGCILAALYIACILMAIWRRPQRAHPVQLVDISLALLIIVISLVQMGAVIDISNTKLVRLEMVGYLGISQFSSSYLVWVWSVSLGIACSFILKNSTHRRLPTEWQTATALILAILGAIGATTVPIDNQQEAFASRGESSGDGLRSLMYWSTAVYVAYISVYWRRCHSCVFPILALGYTALLFLSANRSPIALVLIALLVRSFSSQYVRTLVIGVLISPLALLLFSYQSTWRNLVARGLPSSPNDVFKFIFNRPLSAIQGLGFDSIDGMVLTRSLLEQGFPAQYYDPFIAVLNFIPRQLWDDKPVLLGSTIGWEFLGLTAGGIFLSGPGYTSLVVGSLSGGVALFVVLMMFAKILLQRFGSDPIVCCAILYFTARFPIAGDSFDIFLALQIFVIYAGARITALLLNPPRNN
jgi:hypothetical protein